jgi:ribulose-phosphate 3-epimerase
MDGGVAPATAAACRQAGCDLLVAGSAFFGATDRAAVVRSLRGAPAGGSAASVAGGGVAARGRRERS